MKSSIGALIVLLVVSSTTATSEDAVRPDADCTQPNCFRNSDALDVPYLESKHKGGHPYDPTPHRPIKAEEAPLTKPRLLSSVDPINEEQVSNLESNHKGGHPYDPIPHRPIKAEEVPLTKPRLLSSVNQDVPADEGTALEGKRRQPVPPGPSHPPYKVPAATPEAKQAALQALQKKLAILKQELAALAAAQGAPANGKPTLKRRELAEEDEAERLVGTHKKKNHHHHHHD